MFNPNGSADPYGVCVSMFPEETDQCRAGVDAASSTQECSANQINGFRFGCLLAKSLTGSTANHRNCGNFLANNEGKQYVDSNGRLIGREYVCGEYSCANIYSDDTRADICKSAAQTAFSMGGDPSNMLSPQFNPSDPNSGPKVSGQIIGNIERYMLSKINPSLLNQPTPDVNTSTNNSTGLQSNTYGSETNVMRR